MFNMIIAIFSVVLVLLLALAGIYYAGSAVSVRAIDSEYARLANGASQIKGATQMYYLKEHGYPSASDTAAYFSELIDGGYLSAKVKGEWTVQTDLIRHPIDGPNVCYRMNEIAGKNVESIEGGCPSCDDSAYASWPACKTASN